jgi:uncharacterized protein YndB with AHSA1/START domain
MAFKFQVYGKIARPVAEVFNAVTDPKELSSYFTTGGSSGPLREGATVTWDFADFPGAFPVKVTKVVPNERIELAWEAAEKGYDTEVVMTFESVEAGATRRKARKAPTETASGGRRCFAASRSGWNIASTSARDSSRQFRRFRESRRACRIGRHPDDYWLS